MYAYGTKLHKRIFVLIMFAILYYSSPFHLDSGLKVISHQVTCEYLCSHLHMVFRVELR